MTPLTVPEARAILLADEGLQLSYETRLAAGQTFGIEEREAWARLVASATARIAAYERPPTIPTPTLSPGGNEPDFQTLALEAVAAAQEISCGIEQHIAAPMAAMLNAAGPLARALTEKVERLEALVSNLRTGVINACDAACDSIDQRRFLRQVRHTANHLNLPFNWDDIVEDFATSQLEHTKGSAP
jgi:hypothetical protein